MSETPSTPGTPGSKALVLMKNQMAVFKKPHRPMAMKPKMKILTEEKYIEEMGKIIQRDFFPDLEKLKAQNQYLDAMNRNDTKTLRELYAKYSGGRPSTNLRMESPATFETPLNITGTETPRANESDNFGSDTPRSTTSSKSTSSSKKASNLNLDTFLSHHTSEDNHSFHEIIEEADKRLRQKFAVLYAAEDQQAIEMAKSLMLPDIESQYKAIEGPKTVDTWHYKNKNYIMYIPDGVELTKAEQLEMAKRKQEISYNNTRLQSNPFDDKQSKDTITEIAKTQACNLTGKIDIEGNPLGPNTRGYNFVKTPSPCPGGSETPLMTWGEIEGTPFRLDGSDTPIRVSTGPSFKIVEASRRETIALELAEKAGERMRGQRAKAFEAARRNMAAASPYLKSSLERLATMSPAAKRLASSKLGIKDSLLTPSPMRTPKSNLARTGIVKATPSPLVKRKSDTTPIRKTSLGTTPNRTDLTNDLLNIPTKRKRASDFF